MRLRGGGEPTTCMALVKSGKKEGKMCGKAGTFFDGNYYCGYHMRSFTEMRMANMRDEIEKLKVENEMLVVEKDAAVAKVERLTAAFHARAKHVKEPVAHVKEPVAEEPKFCARFKTKLCLHFEKHGSCWYGSECKFAHGKAELRG